MKAKKVVCALVALTLGCAVPLSACGETKDDALNVIDDNNRNWYEVFVRSYYDSDNDGIGDLKGLAVKLDYIKEMGFNGIWLMPVCESNTYHGYDVVDYYTIEKDYGTNEDFKELVQEAHARGINVIVDMVLNHSSISNGWYQKAIAALSSGTTGENAKYIDYYNFSDEQLPGYAPVQNMTGKYYECRFDSAMPDLNLDSEAVRGEIADILDYWLTDMDVDGFRLDACTSYYTGNVTKNVEFLTFVNETAKGIKEDAYIVGEVWEGSDAQIRQYYESGIDSCFLFTMSAGAAYGSTLKNTFSSLENQPGQYFTNLLLEYQRVYDIGTQAPFLCNHDTARAANMLVGERQVKMGAGLLSLMNGNVFVYYGDEIGMICQDSSSDPTKRIPILWDSEITEGQVLKPPQPGINIGAKAYKYPSVAEQQADSESILNYYKAAMRLRNRHPELARGTVASLDPPNDYVGAFKKTYDGKSIVVLVNLSEQENYTVDFSAYGDVKVVDILDVSGKSKASGKKLNMQPYSIAILR